MASLSICHLGFWLGWPILLNLLLNLGALQYSGHNGPGGLLVVVRLLGTGALFKGSYILATRGATGKQSRGTPL